MYILICDRLFSTYFLVSFISNLGRHNTSHKVTLRRPVRASGDTGKDVYWTPHSTLPMTPSSEWHEVSDRRTSFRLSKSTCPETGSCPPAASGFRHSNGEGRAWAPLWSPYEDRTVDSASRDPWPIRTPHLSVAPGGRSHRCLTEAGRGHRTERNAKVKLCLLPARLGSEGPRVWSWTS